MSTPSWPGPKSCRITPNLFPLVPLPSLHGCGRWEFKHKKHCHVKHVSWKDFVDEEPGRMCWEKPALCFLTLCLIFGQWGLPWWNLWGHAETFSSWTWGGEMSSVSWCIVGKGSSHSHLSHGDSDNVCTEHLREQSHLSLTLRTQNVLQ